MTRLHAHLDRSVDVATADLPWSPSPAPGVERRRIERYGGEVARLTSIVRYAPGCSFAPHTHGGGEEYLVLSGVFSDEHGHHPAGTYVRNGVGTAHSPFTTAGCVILVRLWWMHPDQTDSSVVHLDQVACVDGVRVLHSGPHERVWLWEGDQPVTVAADGGLEAFLWQGGARHYPEGSWLRRPTGTLTLVPEGAMRVLFRQGHLRAPPALPSSTRTTLT